MFRLAQRRLSLLQREEILTAPGFLRDWYGIAYQLMVRSMNQEQIALEGRIGSLLTHHLIVTGTEPTLRAEGDGIPP